jgi:hypothetical protein
MQHHSTILSASQAQLSWVMGDACCSYIRIRKKISALEQQACYL